MDEVCGTSRVSPEVKVLLLTMARWMDESGRVSVPRERLASLLRCAPRNITAKQTAACEAGLLERTGGGHRGRTAEFRARVDGVQPPERETTVITQSPGKGDDDYHPLDSPKGDDDYHPFKSKGDDSHHPIDEKGGRQSSPQVLTHTDVEDHDTAVVVDLFDEEKPKKKTRTRVARAGNDSPEFERFWDAYPRKVAKGPARKAWANAINDGADPEAIIAGARRYATDPHRVERGPRYTAHPATWLNAERWADEDDPAPASSALVATNGHVLPGTDTTVSGWLALADGPDAQENQR